MMDVSQVVKSTVRGGLLRVRSMIYRQGALHNQDLRSAPEVTYPIEQAVLVSDSIVEAGKAWSDISVPVSDPVLVRKLGPNSLSGL